jgi:hypothetical protein
MSIHALLLTGEIAGSVITAMWVVAFAIAGVRRLISGPFVPEVINSAFIVKYGDRAAAEGWLHRLLVVLDIFLNVVFLRGQQDETMSAHAWRASLEGKSWGKALTYWLDLIQPQHGPKAAVGDLVRALNRVATNTKVLGIQNQ